MITFLIVWLAAGWVWTIVETIWSAAEGSFKLYKTSVISLYLVSMLFFWPVHLLIDVVSAIVPSSRERYKNKIAENKLKLQRAEWAINAFDDLYVNIAKKDQA